MNKADVLYLTHRLEQIMKDWVAEPIIKALLSHESGPNWTVTLTALWPDELNRTSSMLLDDCVDWTTEKLKDNATCIRIAWNIWRFESKKDAEKFITLFHLSWEQ